MKSDTINHPITGTRRWTACDAPGGIAFGSRVLTWAALALACAWFGAGCETQVGNRSASQPYKFQDRNETILAKSPRLDAGSTNAMILREGDTVRITFPGAPNLNMAQLIRRDGQITLPMGGELKAAGKRPAELESELLKIFGPQLQFKEVVVAVDSSVFPVFVTGAVLRPGRVTSDRPITALEAIMEAGGFDYNRANLKAVVVIRHEDGQIRNFKLNLKLPLEGKPSEPFFLKPSDIVYVKERFSFF